MVEIEKTPKKLACYLVLIAEATGTLSKNAGTLRSDIWLYMLRHHRKEVASGGIDYFDFLLAIEWHRRSGYLLVAPSSGKIKVERDKYA